MPSIRAFTLKVAGYDRFNCDVVVDRVLGRSRERNMWNPSVISTEMGDRVEIRQVDGYAGPIQVCAKRDQVVRVPESLSEISSLAD